MTVLDEDYFNQFGFSALLQQDGDLDLHLTYGIIEEIISPIVLPPRASVLFSIIKRSGPRIEASVTPALLNMPSTPPFLFSISGKREIVKLFDAHRRLADALDFSHERVAQYLTLCHLSRTSGTNLDGELLAYLARSDMDYARKLYTVLEGRT